MAGHPGIGGRRGKPHKPETIEKIRHAAHLRYQNDDERKRASEKRRAAWADTNGPYASLRYRPGDKASNWKGGITVQDGYILIYCPEHPSRQGKSYKYVLRSHLVVEQQMGRYLYADEVVHHINGDCSDDRSENLVVLSRGAHITKHNILGRPNRPMGSKHSRACLTEDDVRKIKVKLASGVGRRALEEEFNVSKSVIRGIATHVSWKHVSIG